MSENDVKETAKAIQEVARAAGKGIDATREFGGFIAKFIAGPMEQGLGILEDKLRFVRFERQVRLMRRAQEILEQAGMSIPDKSVPIKIAIPLLNAALVEDDDYLQDTWAKLLVNAGDASSRVEVRRAFITVLEELSLMDVKILEAIYSNPSQDIFSGGVLTTAFPSKSILSPLPPGLKSQSVESEPSTDVKVSLANLMRLGCITLGTNWDDTPTYQIAKATEFGKAFYQACTRP